MAQQQLLRRSQPCSQLFSSPQDQRLSHCSLLKIVLIELQIRLSFFLPPSKSTEVGLTGLLVIQMTTTTIGM